MLISFDSCSSWRRIPAGSHPWPKDGRSVLGPGPSSIALPHADDYPRGRRRRVILVTITSVSGPGIRQGRQRQWTAVYDDIDRSTHPRTARRPLRWTTATGSGCRCDGVLPLPPADDYPRRAEAARRPCHHRVGVRSGSLPRKTKGNGRVYDDVIMRCAENKK